MSHRERETILVVDDYITNIQILIEILGDENYHFLTANDGEKAIELLKIHKIDLVLLDIFMPHVSGYEVCDFIKSDALLKEIPVIFITTLHGEEGVIKGFELGAQDYITKPFKNGELMARVKTQLELRRNREHLKTMNEELELKVAEKTAELNEAVDNLKYALSELEKAHKELVDLDQAKMEFLKIISHEIRTPLNGIIGFSDMLANSDLAHEYKDSIQLINESAQRLEHFSNDALLFSQLSLNNYPIHLQETDLNELITETELMLRKNHESRFTLINSLAEQTHLSFDKDLLKRCFYHILENAIVHNKQEDLQICIEYDFSPIDETMITIRDNGQGFPKEVLTRGPKPFDLDRHVDKNPGLGLALVNLILKIHQSRLILENSPAGGAIIKLAIQR